MYIDYTGLSMAMTNLRKYQLVRHALKTGIVQAEPNEYMARGIALHAIAEGYHKGLSDVDINTSLNVLLSDGAILEESIGRAWAMWPPLLEVFQSRPEKIVKSEFEFDITVQGKLGEHHLVGRVDGVTETSGTYKVDEYKGANPGKRRADEEKVWKSNLQADTEMLGCRSLGYPVNHMLVYYIVEGDSKKPAHILDNEPLWVERSDLQLDATLLAVAQWGDILTVMTEMWGNMPWSHTIPSIWDCDVRGRCNSDSDKFTCEFKEICMSHQLPTEMPEGFKAREEHLDIMKSQRE